MGSNYKYTNMSSLRGSSNYKNLVRAFTKKCDRILFYMLRETNSILSLQTWVTSYLITVPSRSHCTTIANQIIKRQTDGTNVDFFTM